MTGIRLWGLIGGIGALVGAALWLTSVFRERDRLRDDVNAAKACTVAVKTSGDVLICPQPIADAAARSRRYLECDAALAKGEAYGVSAACSEAVKRRDAEAAAAAHEAGQLEAELVRTRTQAQAALSRAEARAQTLLRKDQNAALALSRAPVGADGRVRCDDACLQQLLGD
ncbi:hypothetical protein [Polymorphobacter sp.]|uniref:hypothetical protein n=1 Tax=Polymorphobacter sp. TaxID=1909290 RepID=UPI003F72C3DF